MNTKSAEIIEITKVCTKCGEEKALSRFWKKGKLGRETQCGTCNSGIGHLGDSIEIIENAARYLKERLV